MLRPTAEAYWHLIRFQGRVLIYPWALLCGIFIAGDASPPVPTVGVALLAGYLMSLGVYLFNDLTDIEADRISSVSRPLPSGKASKTQAAALIFISSAISLALGWMVNAMTFGFFLLAMVLGVSYSAPKIRAKDRFPLKTLVTCSGAGLASLTGGAVVQKFPPSILLASIVFFVFMLILASVGDLSDLEGDLANGAKSLPVVLGPRVTVNILSLVPVFIGGLVIVSYNALGFNYLTPYMITILCFTTLTAIRKLGVHLNEPRKCRVIRNRLRITHGMLQVALMIGILRI